jgi:hypothetical protein
MAAPKSVPTRILPECSPTWGKRWIRWQPFFLLKKNVGWSRVGGPDALCTDGGRDSSELPHVTLVFEVFIVRLRSICFMDRPSFGQLDPVLLRAFLANSAQVQLPPDNPAVLVMPVNDQVSPGAHQFFCSQPWGEIYLCSITRLQRRMIPLQMMTLNVPARKPKSNTVLRIFRQ